MLTHNQQKLKEKYAFFLFWPNLVGNIGELSFEKKVFVEFLYLQLSF